jgi:hypothetical protein
VSHDQTESRNINVVKYTCSLKYSMGVLPDENVSCLTKMNQMEEEFCGEGSAAVAAKHSKYKQRGYLFLLR